MRVDIQHTQLKTGFFFGKAPGILLTVQYSPEERSIIKDKQLDDYVYHAQPTYSGMPDRMQTGLKIKHHLSGRPCYLYYDTKAAAEADDAKIRASLKKLKELLEQYASSPQSGSYEL